MARGSYGERAGSCGAAGAWRRQSRVGGGGRGTRVRVGVGVGALGGAGRGGLGRRGGLRPLAAACFHTKGQKRGGGRLPVTTQLGRWGRGHRGYVSAIEDLGGEKSLGIGAADFGEAG
jgi:hypothetical protein